jgi:hypothetical protein
MGYFFSLSKSAATVGFEVSEWMLLIFGGILVLGIFGEYKKLPKRALSLCSASVFEILVMVGVAGELLGDGGVFVFSSHLQSIEDHELASLGSNAEQLEARLKAVGDKATQAESTSATASAKSNGAVIASGNAMTLARGARQEADTFEKEIALARKEASDAGITSARVAAKQADRRLSSEQRSHIQDAMRRFPLHQWQAVTFAGDGEAVGLMADIQDSLAGAGWPAPIRFIDQSTPVRGIVVEFGIGSAPITQLAAKTLAESLKAENLTEVRGPVQSAMQEQFQIGPGVTQIAPGVTGSVRIFGQPVIPPSVRANPNIPITVQIGRKP